MRIYLDNCCFNRPYDDQSQLRISLETQAKLYIQDLIKQNKIELATSYILWFENSQNPYEIRQKSISEFFLTTDDRLLKYSTDEIQMVNPIDFIKRLESD